MGPARALAFALVVLTVAVTQPLPAITLIPPSSIIPPIGLTPSTQYLAKLDPVLQERAGLFTGRSLVIVRAVNALSLSSVALLIRQVGGLTGRSLPIIEAQVANVPNTSLLLLAASSLVRSISLDRPIAGALERTRGTVGAADIAAELGYDGTGIGIAIMDSGVAPAHDDLAAPNSPSGQRVVSFVDLINARWSPYDDYGHGTHVAGIIAGNGADSSGARAGIAPRSNLIVLKVLDGTGRGQISNVIAGFNHILDRHREQNIRVVNLSIAAAVYESYNSDPLTIAAKRLVAEGIVVVAAAGNAGRDSKGSTRYGGATSPGNAPWVLTVGAASHGGNADRYDDTIAAFSSRGPGAVDFGAKPDLVAPGVGIESLSDPDSLFYTSKSDYLLGGTVPTSYLPYLSLSGTSMAAPAVTGTVALLLQANPSLTPNAVKAILQYTAQPFESYDALTQGAGLLDARAAVELARYFAAPWANPYPSSPTIGRQLIWGNRRVQGGVLMPAANAWARNVAWGATVTPTSENVSWGMVCTGWNCQGWGPSSDSGENVVWGSSCGGADCSGVTWSSSKGDTVVWGTSQQETTVWGTTVVWGTTCSDASCNQTW